MVAFPGTDFGAKNGLRVGHMNVMDKGPPVDATRKYAPRGLADMIGLTAAINMLRRRMWLVTIVGLTSAALAFSVIMLQPRVYTATALLMLNPTTAPSATAPQQMMRLKPRLRAALARADGRTCDALGCKRRRRSPGCRDFRAQLRNPGEPESSRAAPRRRRAAFQLFAHPMPTLPRQSLNMTPTAR